jgi:hypothetical protein
MSLPLMYACLKWFDTDNDLHSIIRRSVRFALTTGLSQWVPQNRNGPKRQSLQLERPEMPGSLPK